MVQVLNVEKSVAASYFAIVCFLAPLTGVISGGVTTSYYGGYHTKKARESMLIAAWICLAVAIPIPFTDSFLVFGVLIWLLLFFGGALLPALTGTMLSTVSESQRGSANSFATISFNFFGFMPSPFIYGLISKLAGDETNKVKSRAPLATILYSSFFTLIMMTVVILRKLRAENLHLQLSKAEEIF